jgi:hypothetical protein
LPQDIAVGAIYTVSSLCPPQTKRAQTHHQLWLGYQVHVDAGRDQITSKLSSGDVEYFAGYKGKSLDEGGSDAVPYEGESADLQTIVDGYTTYLEQNHALNDYRSLNYDIRLPLDKQDIGSLLWPDAENAQLMNKAYLIIVREQSYTKGRDATVSPLMYMRQEFEKGEKTGIEIPIE